MQSNSYYYAEAPQGWRPTASNTRRFFARLGWFPWVIIGRHANWLREQHMVTGRLRVRKHVQPFSSYWEAGRSPPLDPATGEVMKRPPPPRAISAIRRPIIEIRIRT